jgi:hypothetical protein
MEGTYPCEDEEVEMGKAQSMRMMLRGPSLERMQIAGMQVEETVPT